eukprot:3734496-Pleurochrysis_carterae.AAC.2
MAARATVAETAAAAPTAAAAAAAQGGAVAKEKRARVAQAAAAARRRGCADKPTRRPSASSLPRLIRRPGALHVAQAACKVEAEGARVGASARAASSPCADWMRRRGKRGCEWPRRVSSPVNHRLTRLRDGGAGAASQLELLYLRGKGGGGGDRVLLAGARGGDS